MSDAEFKMTKKEYDEIMEISTRPSVPVMVFGDYISGGEKQEASNKFWKKLANKYGFDVETAKPSEKEGCFFTAIKKA